MRSLPEDVAAVLDLLLDGGNPLHQGLRGQLAHLTVRERCRCGCGSAFFETAADAPPLAPMPPGVHGPWVEILDEAGEPRGDVTLHARDGSVLWLEVCTEDYGSPKLTLAEARSWLQARSGSGR